jgi:predicted amidohydrolase
MAQERAAMEPVMVRVVAVAYRHSPDRVASYETFRASVREVMARHVAPQLPRGRPALVAFPEHTGLMAFCVGGRGAEARRRLAGGASAVEALLALAEPYADPIRHYLDRFGDVGSTGRLLQLALTDALVRAVVETFAGVAAEHGVHVAVGTDLADYRRVEGPAVRVLADPELDAGYAYEATAPAVRNRCLWFTPDGRLADAHDKAYLVPFERDEAVGLGLTAARLDELHTVDLVFGRVGTVTSKDAWMVDVVERLDQLGATLLVQPEAFDRWGDPGADLWPPDKLQRGGWWAAQRLPAVRAVVTPMLVGNLGDLRFDGQPLVAVRAPGGDHGLGLLGQPPDAGWAAVGHWDGVDEPPDRLADPARRRAFAARAARLTPGADEPIVDGDRDGAVAVDVAVPAPPVAAAAAAASRLPAVAAQPSTVCGDPGGGFVPAVAPDAGRWWLAWVDAAAGRQRVVVAGSADGRAWKPPVVVDPTTRPSPFDRQWRPALAVTPHGPVVAYLSFARESWDVYAAGGGWPGRRAAVRVDDAERDEGVLRERGHAGPRLAAVGGGVVAVWSDLRWPWVHAQLRLCRSADRGATWSSSSRVDGGAVRARVDQLGRRHPAETRGQAFPAVVAVGTNGLVVAWQERTAKGGPAVWAACSRDAGASFASPRLVAGGDIPAWRPALAADGRGVWLAWEEATVAGGSRVALCRSDDAGDTWHGPVPADPTAPSGAVQRCADVAALGGGRVAVVFEDHRAGAADIVATVLDSAAPRRVSVRLSDNPAGSHARAPAAAAADGQVVIAWQDTRGPREQVRARRLDLDRLAPT